jgi:hypothetical protein
MASKKFTDKQKEIVARRLGYDGPMQGFDEFLRSNPALQRRYGTVVERYMAKGGAVTNKPVKMQEGGTVTATQQQLPATPEVPTVTAATAEAPTIAAGTGQVGPAATAALTTAEAAPAVAAPTPVAAPTYTAAQAVPAMEQQLAGVQAAQGTVSEQAQVKAATQEPTTTALAGMEAAQARPEEYVQVQAPEARKLQAAETVAGPAVDFDAVERTLAQAQAAQGEVTSEMTVQGQLNTLLSSFDAGNPPAWAAGAMRNATAVMAQRGLGASSLAGQAIIQATLEAATPIAAADAATFERMGMQNLSNRQQMAVLTAQQRAQFLGQEFDQAFQARVINAAKVSDIANMNFNAEVQVALENARLAQTVNLTNLNNRQAMTMAKAAQIANLETQNLSNMQQAAVENAKAFLQMDLTNLGYEQQTSLFKAQEMAQALLTDTAARNAALQFNATSQLQADQFNANLATQVQQFNTAQMNAVNQFNASSANALSQFNASQQNARDQFNAQNGLVVAQANAQLLAQVSLANTASINAANQFNAQAALGISTTAYNAQVQVMRDNMQYAWQTGENALSREMELAKTRISTEATRYAADRGVDAAMYEALGAMGAKVLETGGGVGSVIGDIKGVLTSGTRAIANFIAGGENPMGWTSTENTYGEGWKTWKDPEENTVFISPNQEYYYNGELVWTPTMSWNYESTGSGTYNDYDFGGGYSPF